MSDRCPTCGHRVGRREIALYRGLIWTLFRVYEYVLHRRTGGYRFTRKEIKHLFESENDTGRFGDLVLFGGLVFKDGKARYGLNMERCELFFKGELQIPTKILKSMSPMEDNIPMDFKVINDIPHLSTQLDSDGFYVPVYRKFSFEKKPAVLREQVKAS